VGNNGCVVVRYDKDVFIYYPEDNTEGDIIPELSDEALAKTSSSLYNIFLNDEGTVLCVCRITPKSKVSQRLLGALASVRTDKGLLEHEILFYDISLGKFRSINKVAHPVADAGHFRWTISRDFSFLLVGNPRKGPGDINLKYSIIETKNSKSVRSFELKDLNVQKVIVTNEATALLDASQRGARSVLVVTKSKNTFNITPPINSEVIHLGQSFVAFISERPPVVQSKSYDDLELNTIPLTRLNELGITYGILFNVRDSVDFLYFNDQALVLAHAELSTLLTEVKRCALTRQEKVELSDTPVELEGDGMLAPGPPDYLMHFMSGESSLDVEESQSTSQFDTEEAPISGPGDGFTYFSEEGEPVSPEEHREVVPLQIHEEQEPPPLPLETGKVAESTPVQASMASFVGEEEQSTGEGATSPQENIPTRGELYLALESLKLRHTMGMVDAKEYHSKKQEIEKLIITYYSEGSETSSSEETQSSSEPEAQEVASDDSSEPQEPGPPSGKVTSLEIPARKVPPALEVKAEKAPPTLELKVEKSPPTLELKAKKAPPEPEHEPEPEPEPQEEEASPAPEAEKDEPAEAGKEKIKTLLETLEQRFIMGEITEKSYLELSEKYKKML